MIHIIIKNNLQSLAKKEDTNNYITARITFYFFINSEKRKTFHYLYLILIVKIYVTFPEGLFYCTRAVSVDVEMGE